MNKHALLISALLSFSTQAQTLQTPTPTNAAIHGEQISILIDDAWFPAWQNLLKPQAREGQANAEQGYNVEYIPRGQDIEKWRGEYLLVSRMSYPVDPKEKENIANNAAQLIQTLSERHCGQNLKKMPTVSIKIDGQPAVMAGGYCPLPIKVSPKGEGSIFVFIEGKEYLHRVSFNWRPLESERAEGTPVIGTSPERLVEFAKRLQNIKLCGRNDTTACQ